MDLFLCLWSYSTCHNFPHYSPSKLVIPEKVQETMALACFVTHETVETVETLYLLKRFVSIQDIKSEMGGLRFVSKTGITKHI